MKVLITGVTNCHCNSAKTKVDYAQATDCLLHVVKLIGAEVEQRRVEWGEDLSSFDVILVGITKINSFAPSLKNMIGVAWAVQEFRNRIILFYDDWAAMAAVSGAGTTTRTFPKRLAFWDPDGKMPKEQADGMLNLAHKIYEPDQFKAALLPAFPWAAEMTLVSKFLKCPTTCWDPTPFCNVFDPTPEPVHTRAGESYIPQNRERQWVLATIQDHRKWVEKMQFTWPVEEYGVKRLDQPRITEAEVRLRYKQCWGVLAPEYKGIAGWWRARFYHAAEAGAVLLCGPDDANLMGKPYQKRRWEIEKMSEGELARLAFDQKEWLSSNITPAGETVAKVEKVLQG